MLYQKDSNFAKGYAFTTYQGAEYVLQDAQDTARKGGYSDLWKDATITVIPASIAVRLALQPKERTSQKTSNPIRSSVEIVPSYEDRESAMKIDRQFYKDVSKTPLFYFDNKLPERQQPAKLYFNPDDLVADWEIQYGKDVIPPRVQAIDLITLFQYVIRGRSNDLPNAIKNNSGGVVFVANEVSISKAKELKSQGLAPYKPDKMII